MKNNTVILAVLAVLSLTVVVAGVWWWQQTQTPNPSTPLVKRAVPTAAKTKTGNQPTYIPAPSGPKPTTVSESTTPAPQNEFPTLDEKSGKVTAINGSELTLNLGGETKTFTIDPGHPAIKMLIQGEPKDDSPPVALLKASDIKVGDKVTAYINKSGVVQSITVK